MFLQVCAVYYGSAIFLHFIIPSVVPVKYLQPGKIQQAADVKRDAIRSFLPLVIKGLSLFAVEVIHRKGYGILRDTPVLPMIQNAFKDPRDIAAIISLWFFMDLFHDTWFYFVHRILHSRWILRHVHYMHHQSTTPSAFSGYSFHWQVRPAGF